MAIIKIKNQAIDLDAAEIPNLPATKITSGTFDNARISLDAAEIPNLDTAKITTGTLADARIPANALNSNVSVPNQSAFKNIIINGDMSIAQRATSTASITGNGYHTIDRFNTINTTLGTWTQSQDTDVPSGYGFAKSLKMDCTTADASPASGDRLDIQQKFEGQNLQYLKKGTSNAESLTLSFWVKATKTGTNICELWDSDNARQISQSYTISSSDTWEKKTLTFAGDTTGALGNDNGNSLQVSWFLAVGSNYSSGTLSTTWTSNTNANRAVGQVNHADSTSNNFYITGVQLEAGTTASDFEFLPVDINLGRCQRYFELCTGSRSAYSYYAGVAYVNPFFFKVTKRATPSISKDEANFTMFYNNGFDANVTWNSDIRSVDQITIYMNSTRPYGFIGPDETKPFKADSEL